jgi:hypothetical protein
MHPGQPDIGNSLRNRPLGSRQSIASADRLKQAVESLVKVRRARQVVQDTLVDAQLTRHPCCPAAHLDQSPPAQRAVW